MTMDSPQSRWQAGTGKRVGIVRFGGLGKLAVQIAHALGAHTPVLANPADHAHMLGTAGYRDTTDPANFADLAESFDLVVSTVRVSVDVNDHCGPLGFQGPLVNLGLPEKPLSVEHYFLLTNRRTIAGSMSGGRPRTQQMVDFCAQHGIGAQVELIAANQLDVTFDRLTGGDVRYRFVFSTTTIAGN
jgi:alcohol dehydrogenase (NADP+)